MDFVDDYSDFGSAQDDQKQEVMLEEEKSFLDQEPSTQLAEEENRLGDDEI
ncbi:MAG: hypothetical protein R3B41_01275 [Candidatus Doudnabacteria bacterium]